MYRLAVLADLHGNLPALEAVLEDIRRRGSPDAIWVLGDLVAFLPWLSDTIDCLRSVPLVSCLQGNTDRYLVTGQRHAIPVRSAQDWARMSQMLALRDTSFGWMVEQLSYTDYTFLRDLPHQLELEIGGFGRILGVHGVPGNDEGAIQPDVSDQEIQSCLGRSDVRLVLCGHTHVSMQRIVGGVRWVNPGSVGFAPSDTPYAAYAWLAFSDHACQVDLIQVPYDVDRVIDKLLASSYPGAKGLLPKFRSGLSAGSPKPEPKKGEDSENV